VNESNETRITKLEQHRTIADQKEYCGCRCHWKSILDFNILRDEKIIEFAEIMERLDPSYAEGLKERRASLPKCKCKCSH